MDQVTLALIHQLTREASARARAQLVEHLLLSLMNVPRAQTSSRTCDEHTGQVDDGGRLRARRHP